MDLLLAPPGLRYQETLEFWESAEAAFTGCFVRAISPSLLSHPQAWLRGGRVTWWHGFNLARRLKENIMTNSTEIFPLSVQDAPASMTIPGLGLEPKWHRILRALIDGTLNKFEAEKLGDHCLNTTVCELHRDRSVAIESVWEVVPCMGGRAVTRVKRYRVRRYPPALQHARNLIGQS